MRLCTSEELRIQEGFRFSARWARISKSLKPWLRSDFSSASRAVSSGPLGHQLAREHRVPVAQWILDHPAARWHRFGNSRFDNTCFLLNTMSARAYFNRYCMPEAITSTMGGVGPSPRSRVGAISAASFRERPIACMIPIGFDRTGRTVEQTLARIGALPPPMRDAVNAAVASGRYDLSAPLERHLESSMSRAGIELDDETFNSCFRLTEEAVQGIRRCYIFAIARRFPVLVQSDESAARHVVGGAATFEHGVSMSVTLQRMKDCRAVLSVSHVCDMVHDRTMNAVNAGCVPIVEDNVASRNQFEPDRTALFFRYDDESLEECFEVVCGDVDRCYRIAEAAFARRHSPNLQFGEFGNLLAVLRRQSAALERLGRPSG
jgi:hypothetical protein